AAVVFALFVLGFVSLAGAAALDLVLPLWAALLVVAGIYLVLAVIAVAIGRSALAAPATPERTKQTVKEDLEWAKHKLQR
ncbi:MAG TPA: phage holin family protein, partial [Actinomycetota bacterium]|nr:phage holin family protein [Actinomycetota bacterium]